MKLSNSFTLSLIGIATLTGICILKGFDTSGAIVTLCIGYIGSRAGLKGTGMIAASRDEKADTLSAIEKLRD